MQTCLGETVKLGSTLEHKSIMNLCSRQLAKPKRIY